jgi:hypothetical protein
MKPGIWAALLTNILAFASAQSSSSGAATYTPITTVIPGGPAPTNTFEAPPAPTQTTPAVPPGTGSYQLNRTFEITNTPVTRIYNWTIA